jgi:hypothetical protein
MIKRLNRFGLKKRRTMSLALRVAGAVTPRMRMKPGPISQPEAQRRI